MNYYTISNSFTLRNFKIQMQKNVNTKSASSKISKIRHYSRILDNGRDSQKFASFEGVQTTLNPLFLQTFGHKKSALEKR